MTLEEHELYLKRKKELESEARKHVEYETLLKELSGLKHNRSCILKGTIKHIETTNDPYTSLHISDVDFARNKLVEIYDNEIELLKQKINSL